MNYDIIKEEQRQRKQANKDDFIRLYLPLIVDAGILVENIQTHGYRFHTEKFGILQFFPQRGRLLVQKENAWISDGLKFIRKHILNEDINDALQDDSIMPFGKFRSYRLEDVPYWWLLWFYREKRKNSRPWKFDGLLIDYIEENMDVLEKEEQEAKE